MVVRLIGTVNGDEVIFKHAQGDVWETSVPSSLDGTYVVDMTAYDEAGNATYWAKYILTIDLASLCVHLQLHPYQSDVIGAGYMADLCGSTYQVSVIDELCAVVDAPAYCTVLKGGCTDDVQ